MITIENICFHYRNHPDILQNVSFSLEEGQFLAVLGNNGAGKSTLLKCLNHILKADSGRALLNGKDFMAMSGREAARHIAFVSQTIPNTQMTVQDVVMLGRRPYMRWGFTKQDYQIVHNVMKRMNLNGDISGRFFNQLSGGEQQKVMLARALAQQPKILLLDEPTSSLDIRNQYQVLNLVRDICQKDGITSIMVIHDVNLALKFCDRFLLMRRGQVYRCGNHSILDASSLKEVYDIDAKMVEVEGQHMVLVAN